LDAPFAEFAVCAAVFDGLYVGDNIKRQMRSYHDTLKSALIDRVKTEAGKGKKWFKLLQTCRRGVPPQFWTLSLALTLARVLRYNG